MSEAAMVNPKAIPLETKINYMSSEILRFINAIVADRTKSNEEIRNIYSSKRTVDMRRLSVTFSLHNAITQTIVHKSYDLNVFAKLCSDQKIIEVEFNELTDYMLTKSNEFKDREVVLEEN